MTPSFVDIDGDGDMDAFFGCYARSVAYYKNVGNNTRKALFNISPANPLSSISVGENSAPMFVDIDGDGDMDAFLSGYAGPPTYTGIHYYKNTGTAISPTLAEQTGTANPLDLNDGPIGVPQFVDIDGDGDMDAFIGYYPNGIHFFENTGSATNPTFTLTTGSANPLNLDANPYADPSFVDIDGDGDMDTFVGNEGGTIAFYKNNSLSIRNYIPMMTR